MLTLGLTEGALAATVGLLILVGMADENAPLHKIFGPMVVAVTGTVAYMIHASGLVSGAGDVVGLGFFALLGFYAPLAFMRAAWKSMRATERPTIARSTARAVKPSLVKLETPLEEPGHKAA